MPVVYRHQKGAPLTSDEIDGNFEELLKRIETLEITPTPAEGIKEIEQNGDTLNITGSYGTSFGHFKLPLLTYTMRGKWEANTSYAAYNVVAKDAQTWVCVTTHHSGAQFEEQNWKVFLDLSEALNRSVTLTQVPIFTKDNLPKAEMGALGLYATSKKVCLIYGDGRNWHALKDEALVIEEEEEDEEEDNDDE